MSSTPQRLRAALVAEHRKLVSTRIWWILALAMAAYLAFVGGVLALSATVTPPGEAAPQMVGIDAALSTYGVLNAIGYVFPLVVGTLAVTTEHRHRTIEQTYLAEPRRGVVLLAKLLGTVPVGMMLGVVGTLGLVATAAPVLAWQGDGAYLTSGRVWETLLLGVVVTALWAVLGAAFGAVLTNQVAAIVVVLAFTQFVEPIARVALAAFEPVSGVAAYLPGAAADAVVGASFFSGFGGADLLPRWGGALVLLAYVAALGLVGWWRARASDV